MDKIKAVPKGKMRFFGPRLTMKDAGLARPK